MKHLRLFELLLFLIFAMNLSVNTLFAQKTAGIPKSGITEVDQLVKEGSYKKAIALLEKTAAQADENRAWELGLYADILRRIKKDFNRDEAYVKETLSKYYPSLTDEQLRAWEDSGALEKLMIDGEKRYFRNAVWNLFRIDEEAAKVKEKVDGPANSDLFDYVNGYFSENIPANASAGTYLLNESKLRLTYTLTVKADAVPAGELIRAWLPYPREDAENQSSIQLIESSPEEVIQAPSSSPHSSLYMEKEAIAGEPTVFYYELTYNVEDYWVLVDRKQVQAYDTTSDLYQKFTAERLPHIPFRAELKDLASEITEGKTHPYDKAFAIWKWIGENIPWTSALEYSTMSSISSYCALNGRGDCGMKAMLFITLCRISGVPAKWQSGWYMYPVERNLHDWAEIYFEGIGWIPVDPDFNARISGDVSRDRFFFGGRDKYRLVVNEDFSGNFYPAKIHPRSETVDFQRGEVEWKGGNLYFDQWSYRLRQYYDEE